MIRRLVVQIIFHADEKKHSAYMLNPIGKGYHKELSSSLVDGTPLPNTEEVNRPIKRPDDKYRPDVIWPGRSGLGASS